MLKLILNFELKTFDQVRSTSWSEGQMFRMKVMLCKNIVFSMIHELIPFSTYASPCHSFKFH